MDTFITKWKREMEEKCENGDSAESQRLKSATVAVPICDFSGSSVDSSTSKRKIPKKMSRRTKWNTGIRVNPILIMDLFQLRVTHLFHSARFTIKFYPTTLRNRLYFIDTS
jgi:hypothetical protein